jgi:hypothetical protein
MVYTIAMPSLKISGIHQHFVRLLAKSLLLLAMVDAEKPVSWLYIKKKSFQR